jgi:acetyltransferase
MPNLSAFFYPKSIAVVGGSERESSMGGLVLQNLRNSSFEHSVYAVNLKFYRQVFGFRCVRHLKDIPEAVDLAIICIPPEAIPRVLIQMGRLNIRAAMILTGGLARQLNFNQENNRKIADLARTLNIRLMGPNCLGILVPEHHLNASYTHIEALPGSSAYVGHSAALGSALLDWAGGRGIGFSHFLTLGASADIRISDVVDYLAADRRVKAILIHLEQIRDANRLLTALRAASRSKKVLALRTHTRDALPNGVTDIRKIDSEYFTRAGVLQVDTIDGLFGGLEILSRSKPLHYRNLAIVSNGLGTALLARQYLLANQGVLAAEPLSEEVKKQIWYVKDTGGNPAILPPQVDGHSYVDLLKALEKEPGLGALLVIHSPNRRSDSLEVAKVLLSYAKRSRRLVLTCFLGGLTTQKARQLFDGRGLLNFDSPTEAVNAYLTLARHTEAQEKLRETPTTDALDFLPDKDQSQRVINQARKDNRRYLTWPESRYLMRAYGFKLVDSTFDTDFERLVTRLTPRYFPAALRIVHETYSYPFAYQRIPAARWRGARIEIPDEAALRIAHEELKAEKEKRLPDSRILGWGVQPMRRKVDALQFSLGITRDETYGPMIFFGEGGSHADMLADRQVAMVPLNTSLARQLIEKSHGYKVLLERSDDIDRDMKRLVMHCVSLSQMVIDNPRLAGVEVNLLIQGEAKPLVLGVAVSIGEKVRPALNPYPAELEDTVQLKDGQRVLIRPIKGEDEPELKAFFARFDAESLRLRFFFSRLKFEHLELATMSQIDYRREMVFVALKGGQMLGEMRLWWDINRNEIEFAIMVDPVARGTGLAGILMEKTFDYARSLMVTTIVADVLPENSAMLGLANRFGFKIERDDELMKVHKNLID